MSTKRTLKHGGDPDTGWFHLYEDIFELDDDGNGAVHLELHGVQFEAATMLECQAYSLSLTFGASFRFKASKAPLEWVHGQNRPTKPLDTLTPAP